MSEWVRQTDRRAGRKAREGDRQIQAETHADSDVYSHRCGPILRVRVIVPDRPGNIETNTSVKRDEPENYNQLLIKVSVHLCSTRLSQEWLLATTYMKHSQVTLSQGTCRP